MSDRSAPAASSLVDRKIRTSLSGRGWWLAGGSLVVGRDLLQSNRGRNSTACSSAKGTRKAANGRSLCGRKSTTEVELSAISANCTYEREIVSS